MKSDIVRALSCRGERRQISLGYKKAETAQKSLTSTQSINTVAKETAKELERSWGSAGRGYREIRESQEAQGEAEDSGKYKKTHKAFCLQFT